MDPFEILGVDPDCSEEDLKKAFRKLMPLHHPDKAGPESTEMSQQLIAAYKLLLEERQARREMSEAEAFARVFILRVFTNHFRAKLEHLATTYGRDHREPQDLQSGFDCFDPLGAATSRSTSCPRAPQRPQREQEWKQHKERRDNILHREEQIRNFEKEFRIVEIQVLERYLRLKEYQRQDEERWRRAEQLGRQSQAEYRAKQEQRRTDEELRADLHRTSSKLANAIRRSMLC